MKTTAAIGAAMLMATPAYAVSSFDFIGTVTDGAFTGATGSGTVTYDETLLSPLDDTTLSPSADPLFDLSFMIFGQTFTAANDIDQPNFPEVVFDSSGAPTSLDFIISEVFGATLTAINEPGVFDISIFSDLTPGANGVFVLEEGIGVNVQTIPLPATLPLMIGAIGAFGFAARRKRAA